MEDRIYLRLMVTFDIGESSTRGTKELKNRFMTKKQSASLERIESWIDKRVAQELILYFTFLGEKIDCDPNLMRCPVQWTPSVYAFEGSLTDQIKIVDLPGTGIWLKSGGRVDMFNQLKHALVTEDTKPKYPDDILEPFVNAIHKKIKKLKDKQ